MHPDTVYNKHMLGRQVDYAHVKEPGQINSLTSNIDYDATVTSPARSAHGIGDYDHVQGLTEVHKAASGNDYDTTAASLATYGRRQGEKGDESNYNHIRTSVV
ncbi:hypothetical protein DPMN_107510 [Dreissena polymorpha]|uniref:Uncharacterized protein n=1 Tax=Dreissena polymorpha TaxID=45954 RepID=A0A9D4K7B4_DREPO|nr:hypothetical protein DPMN_107510 [Dreissena polymorpha]